MLNFAEIKASVPIVKACHLLNLHLTEVGAQLRGVCPRCGGDERGIVVTPEKNLFYCFNAQQGGDVLSLVAHMNKCSVKEAALFLTTEQPKKAEEPKVEAPKAEEGNGLAPLPYLDPAHDMVQNLGFPEPVAKAAGVGYAKKGMMRGTVAIPIYTDGVLIGYIGIKEARPPKAWKMP